MKKTLSNGYLTIQVNSHGAELCSIRSGNMEYLWQADPEFWSRHSPVLFPIVGRIWNDTCRINGSEFNLSQHGFARDMEFTLFSESDNEVWFRLTDNEETLKKYPFRFCLDIGYRIIGEKIDVFWRIINTGEVTMPFQIGAHPGFCYPDFNPQSPSRGFFHFGGKTGLEYILVKEKGCADPDKRYHLDMQGEYLPLDVHTFDNDALIIDNSQVKEVSLCKADRSPWVTLAFDTPLVGLWSPPGKNAPFVCIEPWYGRCDRVGYTGEFKDRDWCMSIGPGEDFKSVYSIRIHI